MSFRVNVHSHCAELRNESRALVLRVVTCRSLGGSLLCCPKRESQRRPVPRILKLEPEVCFVARNDEAHGRLQGGSGLNLGGAQGRTGSSNRGVAGVAD